MRTSDIQLNQLPARQSTRGNYSFSIFITSANEIKQCPAFVRYYPNLHKMKISANSLVMRLSVALFECLLCPTWSSIH